MERGKEDSEQPGPRQTGQGGIPNKDEEFRAAMHNARRLQKASFFQGFQPSKDGEVSQKKKERKERRGKVVPKKK